MANPFASLGAVPIMQTIQDTLQRQASLQNQYILGAERQQMMQIRGQEMQERQATMSALKADFQGGLAASIDKTDIPSDSDSPIMLAQKQVRQLEREVQTNNQRARMIADAGGAPEVAHQYLRDAQTSQAKLTSAMRELRLEQRNQAREMSNVAADVGPENFPTSFAQLRALDPQVDRKYSWDRDVDGKPVWGDTTKRTLDTIRNTAMTAKEQVDERLKADKAIEDAKVRESRLEEEKVRIAKLKSEAAIAQVNAERAGKGLPLLRREGVARDTKESKSVDRLQALADREPTKAAVESSQASIRSYAKDTWPGFEFDETLSSFARSVAAKTNSIRAEAAKRGEDMDLDEARLEAIESLKPFVKETTIGGHDLPFVGHIGGSKVLTFRRAGVPNPEPKPAEKVSGKDATVMIAESDRTVLKSGLALQGRGTEDRPFVGVKTKEERDQLPADSYYVGPDGVTYHKAK